jgi:Zn-finger nucleic acid-binding protein
VKCPLCKTPELKPTMIEPDLPAMGCSECEGTLLSLLSYRHWAEHQTPVHHGTAPHADAAMETADTTAAITCPKCSRIMTKYKVTGTVSNRLDVCGLCDEAWLDRGEWQLLQALRLSHKIPAIFTEQWQRRLHRELVEDTRRAILARAIGEEGVAKVEEFKAWLAQNKHKPDIMAYLYRD